MLRVQEKIKVTPGITITLKDAVGEEVASFDSTTTVEQLRAMVVATCQTVTIEGIPAGRFQEGTSLCAPETQTMDRSDAPESTSSSCSCSAPTRRSLRNGCQGCWDRLEETQSADSSPCSGCSQVPEDSRQVIASKVAHSPHPIIPPPFLTPYTPTI